MTTSRPGGGAVPRRRRRTRRRRPAQRELPGPRAGRAPPPRPGDVRWAEREEIVSDGLEGDFWKALLSGGRRFGYTGTVSCEWGDHPWQRHKIISGRGARHSDWRTHTYGLSAYRQFYGVPRGCR
ncbi:hypothetical protein NKH77_44310 [Streptomyces sp. M19]